MSIDFAVGAPTTPTSPAPTLNRPEATAEELLHGIQVTAARLTQERDDARTERDAALADKAEALRLAEAETGVAIAARNLLNKRGQELRAVRDGAFRHKSEADRLSTRCRELAEALDDARTQIAALTVAHERCQPRRRFWRKGRRL
jgi:hypothetical protein